MHRPMSVAMLQCCTVGVNSTLREETDGCPTTLWADTACNVSVAASDSASCFCRPTTTQGISAQAPLSAAAC